MGDESLSLLSQEVIGHVHGAAGGRTPQEIVPEKEADKPRGAER